MSAQREPSLYPDAVVNATKTPPSNYYSPSYPPKSSYPSDDDVLYKGGYGYGYDEDIINSYALTNVPLPIQGRTGRTHPSPASVSHGSFDRKTTYSVDGRTIPNLNFQHPQAASHDRGDSTGRTAQAAFADKEANVWKKILPDSLACRLYVLIVLLETITDIAIEGDLLVQLKNANDQEDISTQRLSVYLTIFVFAHLFQLFMACDAVYARNTLQFLFLTLFNAVFLVYAVIQIFEIRSSFPSGTEGLAHIPLDVLTTVIPIVISVAEVAYIALGWKIWQEFGWKVYKFLGADRRIKRMYARYQIFICLLKFDVFFFIGFTVQLIFLVLQDTNWEYFVTIAALPASFIVLIIGILAAKNENKAMMIAFMVGLGGAMVYFVWKLVKIFVYPSEFAGVRDTLTTFAVVAMAFLLATFAFAIIVMRNFGEGLKYHIANSGKAQNQAGHRGGQDGFSRHSHYPMSASANRMSIE